MRATANSLDEIVASRSMMSSPSTLSTHLGRPTAIAIKFLVFAAVAWVALQVSMKVSGILLSVLVAIILSSLLAPAVNWLHKKWPINRYIIAIAVLLVVFFAIGGIMALAAGVLINGSDDLVNGIVRGLKHLETWLTDGPFNIDMPGVQAMTDSVIAWVTGNSQKIASGVLAASGSISSFLGLAAITLMTTLFFIADGHSIASWFLRFAPADKRADAKKAALRAWHSLTFYARSQILVAGVDAIGIAVGALILGVPFVLPIGVLVFFASFIPIVGALFSGAVAVLVALAFGGPIKAILMLLVILIVQQLESNVWSPILLGGAVQVHPWAIFIGVSCGTYLMGMLGALLAVPVMASINSAFFSTEDPEEKRKKKSQKPRWWPFGKKDS